MFSTAPLGLSQEEKALGQVGLEERTQQNANGPGDCTIQLPLLCSINPICATCVRSA